MKAGDAPGVGATEKVVRVIEALVDHSGVTEISRRVELPTSTVHRIVQELQDLGWARRDGQRGYLPGTSLLTLASRAETGAGVSGIIRPIAARLRDETTYTVHFGLRQGDHAVYVVKLDGTRAYEMRSRVGRTIPMHSTAIGKAILGALPEDEARALLERTGTPPVTPRTMTDADAVLAHVRRSARRGYTVDNEENELHTRCIGAVVRDAQGTPVGALSLSAMAFELTAHAVTVHAPLVVAAAREMSEALGEPGNG